MPPPTSSPSPRGSSFQLAAILLLTLLAPLLVRPLHHGGPEPERLSYLPSLEGRRQYPFATERISELQHMQPGYVVIGDSMAGTRINERVLGPLAGRPVAPLLQAGTGPAFWYLALKNWVVASGVTPRVVFIFFRDTNLTDTMFRLDEQFRWSLDPVAREREEELDAIVEAAMTHRWSAVHAGLERAYGGNRARRWIEPALNTWPAAWITSSRRRQAEMVAYVNSRFGLDHLRVMDAADIAADEGTDFHDALPRSVLPLMLRDAGRAGLTLCFVRVQRRPAGGQPPVQPPSLRRYMADLRAWLEARGALLHDDTGDPAMTLDMYGDGDHIAGHARDRYTRLFYERLRPLFQTAR